MSMPAWTEADLERVVARGQVRVLTAPTRTRFPRTPPPAPARHQAPVDRYRSQTERRFVRDCLEVWQHEGKIKQWWYEPCKGLFLAPKTTYTPDFLVQTPDSRLHFYEIKGAYIRPHDWIKVKLAAAKYACFPFWLAQWRKGRWQLTAIPAV